MGMRRINCVRDVVGVQICGALKNVVALAAGFCDGLKLGTNTKAAIIRIGMASLLPDLSPFLSSPLLSLTYTLSLPSLSSAPPLLSSSLLCRLLF